MTSATSHQKGPLLKIVELGLNLWIRNQCESIEEIDLRLDCSIMSLLRGEVFGVNIVAKGRIFKSLPLEYLELETSSIKFNLDLKNSTRKLSLENVFELKGKITIEGQELNRALFSNQWKWLGDFLAKELIKQSSLKKLTIKQNTLEINAFNQSEESSTKASFSVEACSNTILITNKISKESTLIPMDQAIQIEEALISEGKLLLKGNSKVTP